MEDGRICIDGLYYNKDKTKLIGYDEDKVFTELKILDTASFEPEVFKGIKTKDITVYIPKSLISEIETNECKASQPHGYEDSPLPLFSNNKKFDSALTKHQNATFNDFFGSIPNIEKVIVPSGTTKIGSEFFYNYGKMKEVVLPKSVKEIEKTAFYSTKKLEKINLENIEAIGDRAFAHSGVKDIKITDKTRYIGVYTFLECKRLKSLIYNTNVNIPERFCEDCFMLDRLEINDNVKEIGDNAFLGCRCLNIDHLPKELEKIGKNAFTNTVIYPKLVIPEKVKEIENMAFFNTTGIKEIVFENKTKFSIGDSAFGNSGIKEFTIPKNCVSVGKRIVSNCKELETITFDSPWITSIPEGFAAECPNLSNLNFSVQMNRIGQSAFSKCNIKDINKVLKESAATYIEPSAFKCNKYEELILYKNMIIEHNAFSSDTLKKVVIANDDMVLDEDILGDTTNAKVYCVFDYDQLLKYNPEKIEEKDITNTLIDIIPFKDISRIANEVKEINK